MFRAVPVLVLLLVSVALVCAAAAESPGPPAPPAPTAQPAAPGARTRITGRVVDPQSRAGIGSVLVRLDGTTTQATTSTDGSFVFDEVAPGRHGIVASLEGFTPSSELVVFVQPGDGAAVELEYRLEVSTVVRGAAVRPPASPPAVSLGGARMTGQQVMSAISGLGDLGRVMQLRPGVAASQDNRNDLLVRGGGAWETAVRLDGFELPTGSHFAWPGSAGGAVSLIAAGAIESASLDTGGFSVGFGERASGVMDVRTRTGASDRIRGRADLGVGGLFALAEGRLPAPGGRHGSWMASVRRSVLQLGISRRDSRAAPNYTDAAGNLDIPLSPRHRLHATGFGASDALDVDWSMSASSLTGKETLALGGVSLASAWSDRTRTDLSLSLSRNDTTLSEIQQTETSYANSSFERFLRARAEIRHAPGARVRLMAGASLERAKVDFDLRDGGYRNEWNIEIPPLASSWHDTFTDTAAYGEATWLVRTAEITAGVRADHSGRTGRWYVSPRTRVQVGLGSRWRVTGSWGDYRQDIPNVWVASNAANRTLDPIDCTTLTAGVEGTPWPGGWLTAEAFRKRYTGYPIDPSVPSRVLIGAGADFESPLVGILAPSGKVEADGIDTSFSQAFGGALTLALGYSHWNEREFNLLQQWIRADYDIRHQARVWLVWHKSARWSASALWRYASGRPYTPYDIAASIQAGFGRYDRARTNAVTYPAYHRLDLRVERVLAARRAAVTLFLEAENVYNRANIYIYEWSAALGRPRPALQWGLVPAAGVRIDF
jgi:hypothetical protein